MNPTATSKLKSLNSIHMKMVTFLMLRAFVFQMRRKFPFGPSSVSEMHTLCICVCVCVVLLYVLGIISHTFLSFIRFLQAFLLFRSIYYYSIHSHSHVSFLSLPFVFHASVHYQEVVSFASYFASLYFIHTLTHKHSNCSNPQEYATNIGWNGEW